MNLPKFPKDIFVINQLHTLWRLDEKYRHKSSCETCGYYQEYSCFKSSRVKCGRGEEVALKRCPSGDGRGAACAERVARLIRPLDPTHRTDLIHKSSFKLIFKEQGSAASYKFCFISKYVILRRYTKILEALNHKSRLFNIRNKL